MDIKEQNNGYEKIGPTAWGVSYSRSLSDIKYAAEIFHELELSIKTTSKEEVEYFEASKKSKLAPQFEARQKLIDRLIEENKNDQILEIAAGFSSRGLAMTEKNDSLKYVEVDLPYIAEHKKQILQVLSSKYGINPSVNLRIESGDALDLNSLFESVKYFEQKPISVVNEGLLRYLSFDQKSIVAKNVHALLEKFGGVWITSDITLRRILTYEQERESNRERVLALSGINVVENSFDNAEAAKIFFENLGFSVEKHGFPEVIDQLVSPEKLGLSMGKVQEMINNLVVFVMRVR
ncbi:MAG: class I SAM-dependent methyltransferase [Candidatus Paceibacterota bacterium]|jgi:O-methyltransferase involved in polyketide biosynthesis